jgi:hypothetical protein
MAIDTFGVRSTANAQPRRLHFHSLTERSGPGDMDALELALLRRSLAGLHDQTERCGRCERTMLFGERVYEYTSGAVRCELCRSAEGQSPAQSHTVHSHEFGHTIRVTDRRNAR